MKYFDYVALPAFAGEGEARTSVETTKKIRRRGMDRALAAVRVSRAEEALKRAVGDLADGREAEERLSEEDKQGSADDVKKRVLLAEVTHLAAVVKKQKNAAKAAVAQHIAAAQRASSVHPEEPAVGQLEFCYVLPAMVELDKAKRAALAGGATQGDVDAAYIVEGDDLLGDPSKVDAYLSGLKKRADDLKKFAKLKGGETEAAVERAINELAAAKGETRWFSHSTWVGAATGLLVGALLACGVLSIPAAVGLAGVPFLALVSAGLATAVVAVVLGGAIGAGMNWVHGWVEQESAKAAVTGAGVGMILGAGGIIAGIMAVCWATAGLVFIPFIVLVSTSTVLSFAAWAVVAWGYSSESSISPKDAAAPDTPESAELSRS